MIEKVKKVYKKSFFCLCFVFCFVLLHHNVHAGTKMALVTYNNASLRTAPGTKNPEIAVLNSGTKYNLADENIYTGSGCSSGWYKLIYNENTTGYVCASLLSIVEVSSDGESPKNACETELFNLGFPSSYWAGLCSLKNAHPNWSFQPVMTNLDWETVVDKESACRKSYISFASSINENYIDRTCKGEYATTYYPASQQALAFYMDPRNWFDEKYIFQFNYLKYDDSITTHYTNGVRAIIGNTDFYQYNLGKGNDLASITTEAGKNTNVSPMFLASRMQKELGNGTSLKTLYSGDAGVYNFFNYGVTDSCATSNGANNCGVAYAEQRGWTTPLLAIQGAAGLLASTYINVGQYTTYFQKFNVVPTVPTNLYIHQYMTDITAPSAESSTTYKSFSSLGILDLGFVFYIPVYNNMNKTINNSGNGGSGDGSTSATTMDIASIVTSSGYRYSNGYISGIPIGTDVATVISSIEAISGTDAVIKTASGENITSGNIATGYKVVVTNSNSREELQVIIKGDTSGDGVVNALDLLQVQKQILGSYSLSGAYKLAGDTSGDGAINALDLLQVQKQILGLYTIAQ